MAALTHVVFPNISALIPAPSTVSSEALVFRDKGENRMSYVCHGRSDWVCGGFSEAECGNLLRRSHTTPPLRRKMDLAFGSPAPSHLGRTARGVLGNF
ncbi:hypothetical protein M426DRAFT_326268, partial [Hypoxylon sp. CI-4A]